MERKESGGISVTISEKTQAEQWEDSWDTKREAEKVLRVRMEELESTFGHPEDSSTTEVYLRYWLRVYCESRLACNTVRGYRVNLEKRILPYIGKIPLKRLQPRDIQELYETRRKSGLSGTTVRYVHNNLHKALSFSFLYRTQLYIGHSRSERKQRNCLCGFTASYAKERKKKQQVRAVIQKPE